MNDLAKMVKRLLKEPWIEKELTDGRTVEVTLEYLGRNAFKIKLMQSHQTGSHAISS